ncbi:hypothetical protein [Planomicrobium sp. MB-3u-38]|uniref:hypothetical protein n=1 Tax=Planomicrobium sp. MB-3u-38 TaxID=2058318 RepID=UPI000C7C5CE2|nr:hypothetical protein [Planomicrobium sp. MB-3u-38]PKH10561.1 hypothetical protein CXF70_09160 [Planomicrobium sp. MB-3u-38]
MYKSKIEICMVITNEVATEVKETIVKAIVGEGYKVNHYHSIEKFLGWYVKYPLEVCLITNESIASESYQELKKQYQELKDIVLIEPSDEISTLTEHNVYIDSKNGEININDLLQAIDFIVEQLEMAMYDGEIDEDYENEMDEKNLQTESTMNIDQVEKLQPKSTPAGEKLNEKINESKESQDNHEKSSEQLEHESAVTIVKEDVNEQEVEIKEPIYEAALENDAKSPLQNNPFPMRLRNIQKSLSGLEMDKNKTIGIWSPLPAVGVTSFLINFSLFLSENKVYTAVLEPITSNHVLKDWLKRYVPIPNKWVSLAHNLHTYEPVGDSEWSYREVKFFPLNTNDIKQDWSAESFKAYHCMTEIFDVTLVDMPTGEMKSFTNESLKYMDELWIIACDRIQQLYSWKDYIKKIEETHNIPIHLIHNQMIDVSKPNLISEHMELPLLATIPALFDETAKNYYQKKPLYLHKKVQPILEPHYHQLATHLIGPSFQLQDKKPTVWERITKITKLHAILNR